MLSSMEKYTFTVLSQFSKQNCFFVYSINKDLSKKAHPLGEPSKLII